MTKLEFTLEVSDQLARDVRAYGLLAPEALTEILQAGLRRKSLERMRRASSQPSEDRPMSLAELQKIVKEVRHKRG